jgi:ABC-type multidrug transport system fused ATPase/permease subunit
MNNGNVFTVFILFAILFSYNFYQAFNYLKVSSWGNSYYIYLKDDPISFWFLIGFRIVLLLLLLVIMGNNIFKIRETAKVNKSGMSHTMNKKKKNNKKKRGW